MHDIAVFNNKHVMFVRSRDDEGTGNMRRVGTRKEGRKAGKKEGGRRKEGGEPLASHPSNLHREIADINQSSEGGRKSSS